MLLCFCAQRFPFTGISLPVPIAILRLFFFVRSIFNRNFECYLFLLSVALSFFCFVLLHQRNWSLSIFRYLSRYELYTPVRFLLPLHGNGSCLVFFLVMPCFLLPIHSNYCSFGHAKRLINQRSIRLLSSTFILVPVDLRPIHDCHIHIVQALSMRSTYPSLFLLRLIHVLSYLIER